MLSRHRPFYGHMFFFQTKLMLFLFWASAFGAIHKKMQKCKMQNKKRLSFLEENGTRTRRGWGSWFARPFVPTGGRTVRGGRRRGCGVAGGAASPGCRSRHRCGHACMDEKAVTHTHTRASLFVPVAYMVAIVDTSIPMGILAAPFFRLFFFVSVVVVIVFVIAIVIGIVITVAVVVTAIAVIIVVVVADTIIVITIIVIIIIIIIRRPVARFRLVEFVALKWLFPRGPAYRRHTPSCASGRAKNHGGATTCRLRACSAGNRPRRWRAPLAVHGDPMDTRPGGGRAGIPRDDIALPWHTARRLAHDGVGACSACIRHDHWRWPPRLHAHPASTHCRARMQDKRDVQARQPRCTLSHPTSIRFRGHSADSRDDRLWPLRHTYWRATRRRTRA